MRIKCTISFERDGKLIPIAPDDAKRIEITSPTVTRKQDFIIAEDESRG